MVVSFKKCLAVFAFSIMALSSQASQAAELQTVPFVDVAQYLGKWYEIARLPQPFQPNCTAVTAEYSLNEDGSIKVFNFCRVLDPVNGSPLSITGSAVAIDETRSKLEVTFFKDRPVGKYWVIELDNGYQWAVVGDPSRRSFFILSRQPTLDDGLYQELLRLAVEKHGYDLTGLIKTIQVAN